MKHHYPRLALLTLAAFLSGCDHDFTANSSNVPGNDTLQLDQPQAGINPSLTTDQSHTPDSGPLIHWGTGQQVQIAVDKSRKQATIYIVGSDGKTAQPIRTAKVFVLIKAPQKEIEFTALPLEDEMLTLPPDGERDGGSSRFVATDELFASGTKFDGTVSGMVDGNTYTGYFKDQPH